MIESIIPFALISNAVDNEIAGEMTNSENVNTYPNSINPIPPIEIGMFIINKIIGTATRHVTKSISELKAKELIQTLITASN